MVELDKQLKEDIKACVKIIGDDWLHLDSGDLSITSDDEIVDVLMSAETARDMDVSTTFLYEELSKRKEDFMASQRGKIHSQLCLESASLGHEIMESVNMLVADELEAIGCVEMDISGNSHLDFDVNTDIYMATPLLSPIWFTGDTESAGFDRDMFTLLEVLNINPYHISSSWPNILRKGSGTVDVASLIAGLGSSPDGGVPCFTGKINLKDFKENFEEISNDGLTICEGDSFVFHNWDTGEFSSPIDVIRDIHLTSPTYVNDGAHRFGQSLEDSCGPIEPSWDNDILLKEAPADFEVKSGSKLG